MVVTEGIRSANPNTKSLFERIASPSRATCRRLMAWTLVTVIASIAAKSLLPAHYFNALISASSLMFVVGACVGFGGATYLLARFVLTSKLRHLILATAFTVIAVGLGLQVVIDMRMPGSLSAGRVLSAAWLISGALFACSAYVNFTFKTTTRHTILIRSALGCLFVLALPLIALPYVFDGSISTYLASIALHCSTIAIAGKIVKVTAVALYVVSFVGFYRRTKTHNDRLAGLLCYAFVPLIIGLLFRLVSNVQFDDWWAVSVIDQSLAWFAIISGFCIENAIMQREAQDRLQELDALHQVSWSVVGAGSVHDLLDMYARTHQEQLGVKVAAVYLADETDECLELFAIRGPKDCPGTIGKKYPVTSANRWPGFHTGHTARAFLSQEVQVANDVFVDVEFIPWRMVAADDGCAVSLPLVFRGKTIGVVNLYYEDSKQLTRQRLRLLSIIAGAAAPAIASAMEKKSTDVSNVSDVDLDLAA